MLAILTAANNYIFLVVVSDGLLLLHFASFKSIYLFRTSHSDLNGKVAGVVQPTMSGILHECAVSNEPGSASDKSPGRLTGTCNLSRDPALLVSPGTAVLLGGAIVAKTMDITNDYEKRF